MDANTTFTVAQITEASNRSRNGHFSMEHCLREIQNEACEKAEAQVQLMNMDCRNLSKRVHIKLTLGMPELSDDLYNELKLNGFKTGSSVYTTVEKPNDEDWCICISPVAFKKFSIGHGDNGYWEADGFTSIYTHYKGQLLNIMCFSDDRLMHAWRYATVTLSNLLIENMNHNTGWNGISNAEDILNVKWKRVRLFSALRDVFYDPTHKRTMNTEEAREFHKCSACSREAIFFTCKAARDHYKETCICERCSGLTY